MGGMAGFLLDNPLEERYGMRGKERSWVWRVEITMVDTIRKRRLAWLGHIARMKRKRIQPRIQRYTCCGPSAVYEEVEGARSRGRQSKKWMENAKEGLTAQGMNLTEAVDNRSN